MHEDLDNWRDQNGRATLSQGDETYAQHAFGFMDASGRKSDFLRDVKNDGMK